MPTIHGSIFGHLDLMRAPRVSLSEEDFSLEIAELNEVVYDVRLFPSVLNTRRRRDGKACRSRVLSEQDQLGPDRLKKPGAGSQVGWNSTDH